MWRPVLVVLRCWKKAIRWRWQEGCDKVQSFWYFSNWFQFLEGSDSSNIAIHWVWGSNEIQMKFVMVENVKKVYSALHNVLQHEFFQIVFDYICSGPEMSQPRAFEHPMKWSLSGIGLIVTSQVQFKHNQILFKKFMLQSIMQGTVNTSRVLRVFLKIDVTQFQSPHFT